jgi:predicted enzyme related to lactoylglutathione lyase
MAGDVSFFELGVEDAERARAFYGALFTWEFEWVRGGFSIAGSNVPGGVHGGDAGASPYVFFAVDDIEAATARVRELGGTVEELAEDGEDDDELATRFGRFKLCRDDQGSPFGLHEPPAPGR